MEYLGQVENVITNVEVDENPGEYNNNDYGYYRIFVYAGEEKIMLASFEGSDGNGYYGTGWWLRVTQKETS